MAIIKCKKCGSLMSSRATVCPKCGWPTSKSPAEPPTTIAGQKAAPEKAQPQTPVDGSLESNNNFRSEPAAENNQVVEAVAAASNQEAEDAVENNQEVGDVSYLLEEDNTSQELTFAITVLALIVLLGVVFFFSTRHSQGESISHEENQSEELEETVAVDEEEYQKLSFERITMEESRGGLKYSVNMLLPEPNTQAAKAIRSELEQVFFTTSSDLKPKSGESILDFARRQQRAMMADLPELEAGEEWQWEFTIDTMMQTKRYINFAANGYVYLGGPHGGGFGEGGITFRKRDGKRITEFFKDPDDPALRPLLIEGLCQYFSESEGGSVTPDDLGNYMLMDLSELKMPSDPPCLTAEGVAIGYTSYEAGTSYSQGNPSFVIPYDQLEPYLTDEVLDLIRP